MARQLKLEEFNIIKIEYIPSFITSSPLPNGEKTYEFCTFAEFKDWVQSYVCIHCLVDFAMSNNRSPETLSEWLDMGCGCEIDIEDDTNQIDWASKMTQPSNLEEELSMLNDDFGIGDQDISVSLPDDVIDMLKDE